MNINTKFRNRARPWGTTSPKNRIGLSIHHTVTAETPIETRIQQINRQHPYGSYGWITPYDGSCYEIVGLDGIGAAVGGANTPWWAVAYLGDGRNRFTYEAEAAIRELVAYLDKKSGKRLQIKGHGQINATACPGPIIQKRINLGAFTLRYSAAHIREVQAALIKLGYDLGSWGADGIWGAYLSRATEAFQKKHKLVVDAIPGPATLAKAKAEVAKLTTPEPEPEPAPEPEPVLPTFVRYTEPLAMVTVTPTHLIDFFTGENVAAYEEGHIVNIVGEAQYNDATYLMTDYSFGSADTIGKSVRPHGFLVDTLDVFVPEDDPEVEPPHQGVPDPGDGDVENPPTSRLGGLASLWVLAGTLGLGAVVWLLDLLASLVS